jgi:hypothetical protein
MIGDQQQAQEVPVELVRTDNPQVIGWYEAKVISQNVRPVVGLSGIENTAVLSSYALQARSEGRLSEWIRMEIRRLQSIKLPQMVAAFPGSEITVRAEDYKAGPGKVEIKIKYPIAVTQTVVG